MVFSSSRRLALLYDAVKSMSIYSKFSSYSILILQVIWNRLFTSKSACAKGTLFQIKNLIHRTSVPNDPKETYKLRKTSLK